MRIDIENKILIPYIVLLIISIFLLGAVSYWNGYQLLLENEIKHSTKDLEEMLIFIDEVQSTSKNEEAAKDFILQHYGKSKEDNLVIFHQEEVLLNHYDNNNHWIRKLLDEGLAYDQQVISTEEYLFTYKKYQNWDWTLGYRLNKGIFFYEVLESQKYILLIAIVSLIFSMQAAIFISYHISKPIKKLAELCDKIVDQESFQEKIHIKRKDEIGILANAFNNMLVRLQNNTEKLLQVTIFNENILRNISAGIITTDKKGKTLSMNDAAKKFLTQDMLNNVDKNIEKSLLNQVEETLENHKKINNIQTFTDMQRGDKFYLDVTTSLLKNHKGCIEGAICNFNDISQRKKVENNMDTLDRLTSIGQLAAGIAHEIRNPLAGMKTSIQVLKNRLCKEGETNRKLFDGVLHEIDRINDLITGLLNFAKPRAPKYEKTDLIEVLHRSLELFRKNIQEKQIHINIEKNDSNTIALVDKGQIEQVFLNIVKNALAAMESQGILDIIFQNSCEQGRYFIEIEFVDNGCGIEPKDLDQIFNPFFTTRSEGTGLGLSVVYELVKENQGEIHIHSIVNKGTKVKIKFPVTGGEHYERKNINCR